MDNQLSEPLDIVHELMELMLLGCTVRFYPVVAGFGVTQMYFSVEAPKQPELFIPPVLGMYQLGMPDEKVSRTLRDARYLLITLRSRKV